MIDVFIIDQLQEGKKQRKNKIHSKKIEKTCSNIEYLCFRIHSYLQYSILFSLCFIVIDKVQWQYFDEFVQNRIKCIIIINDFKFSSPLWHAHCFIKRLILTLTNKYFCIFSVGLFSSPYRLTYTDTHILHNAHFLYPGNIELFIIAYW